MDSIIIFITEIVMFKATCISGSRIIDSTILHVWEHEMKSIIPNTLITRNITYLKLFIVISAVNIIYNSQEEIFPLECCHAM